MDGQKQNRLLKLLMIALCYCAGSVAIATPLPLWAQVEPTATPDAEGVIYSEVRPNDSLWSIAARAGITLEELLSLNDLSENDIIQPGQLLIVGYGTPAPTATRDQPAATATGTRSPPTPTNTAAPLPQTGICLTAFSDVNGNGQHDASEPMKAAVAFTVFDEAAVVANYVTDGMSEPYCLEGLAAGTYQVTRSIGADETLTSAGDRGVILTEGNVIYLEFGSYIGPVPTTGTANNGETADPQVEATSVSVLATPALQQGQRRASAFSTPLLVTSAVVAGLFVGGLFLFLKRSRLAGK